MPLFVSVPLGPFRYNARLNGKGTGSALYWLLLGWWLVPLWWSLRAMWWMLRMTWLGAMAVYRLVAERGGPPRSQPPAAAPSDMTQPLAVPTRHAQVRRPPAARAPHHSGRPAGGSGNRTRSSSNTTGRMP